MRTHPTYRLFLGILLMFTVTCLNINCGSKSPQFDSTSIDSPDTSSMTEQIIDNSNKLEETQKILRSEIEKKGLKSRAVDPVLPFYNPLDDHTISFSIVNESLEAMLHSLSSSVGMNLIIDPDIEGNEKKISLNFEKVKASAVLDEVLNMFDFHYAINDNVIRIQPFQEKIFKLNFLDTNLTTSFDLGGDVLGSGESGNIGGLTGSFKLSGAGGKEQNTYDVLEASIKRVLSKNGTYSLNRLSGNLYVKDSPSRIKTVSKLISSFKRILSRQILIDARIVEVVLSDTYKYGIDWAAIQDKAAGVDTLISAGWNNTAGLVLGFDDSSTSIATVLEALKTYGESRVVSNPTIRAKHGKPAMISVGTSITYIKSEETESSSTSSTTSDVKTIETSNVFDGLILGVIPFIDESDMITLLINPIKSDVDKSSLQLVGTISLPQVNIKEISTTISMNNRETVVLGGLIDKKLSKETMRFPFLSKLPFLGNLFKYKFNSEETRELVIILSVSIL